MNTSCVIGVDFGTDSVRAIVVNAVNGEISAEAQAAYPRWQDGRYCDPAANRFRQHPRDYVECFERCVRDVLRRAGNDIARSIVGIAVDATGSTPCPVDRNGVPLALLPEFQDNPNAMFHLWKDHSAIRAADDINEAAAAWEDEDYTRFQGTYSSEWFWAKILHTAREDDHVRQAAWSWVEHCDWIPALLTGRANPLTMYRSACAAGHKALWHSAFGGLPVREFLAQLDPYLGEIHDHYGRPPQTADTAVGPMTNEWLERLGLEGRVMVGGSSLDAHAGAVGAGIRPHALVKIMGTSTVDMLVEQPERLEGKNLKAICGQAEHSILPGFIGIEAGQAAFGDVYAWFKSVLMWPVNTLLSRSSLLTDDQKHALLEEFSADLLPAITAHCETMPPDAAIPIALDWLNGRRYPDVNEHLKGALAGLHVGTTVPHLYTSLVLATAFGSRRILESFLEQGLRIDHIIASGGIARKSPFVMQILADVLNRQISISASSQACAQGAAMYAAVAAGAHGTLQDAQTAMAAGFSSEYAPKRRTHDHYTRLYEHYLALGNFVEFGTLTPGSR